MIEPMLASLAEAPLDDPQLVYEPKYDGIRAIAEVGASQVRLWSRLGNEKTRQFPEIAAALQQWARALKEPVVLDGEIVALDDKGRPTGFQQLQGRIHVLDPTALIEGSSEPGPSRPSRLSRPSRPSPSRPSRPSSRSRPGVAFIVFDLLRVGRTDLRDLPLVERRAALERLLARTETAVVRLSRQVRGDASALYEQALAEGWEGLIAKHAASLYKSGKRTPDWRKLKIVREQEFVVGGWTDPRHTRSYFGALLLGVYEDNGGPCLTYVGHSGTGFNEKELARVMKLFGSLATDTCPFCQRPKTNERAHWVKPELVAQVRFTEWTADGRLRHPVYLGLRDDKRASEVRREGLQGSQGSRGSRGSQGKGSRGSQSSHGSRGSRGSQGKGSRGSQSSHGSQGSGSKGSKRAPTAKESAATSGVPPLVDQLQALEDARRDGVIVLSGGDTLSVTNLAKVFWPKLKLTKGDLFRYYARVAPAILPVLADRPLVMKRFPNGVAAKPFYQHRAPEVPAGIPTADVKVADRRAHIVGGQLKTLMYTTQLAAISQDPWFSRVPHLAHADHVALDLDPSEGVAFRQVLDVARWIRDELASLGATGWPKTSGADGVHIYIPLPPGTPYDAGLLFCQIIATVVAQKHGKVATVERTVAARGRRVYVDFLQNILGKTLASAYSARASDYAGVSTPLSWKEVDEGVDRHDFTIATVPARLARVGDLWDGLRTSGGVDLEAVTRYLNKKK